MIVVVIKERRKYDIIFYIERIGDRMNLTKLDSRLANPVTKELLDTIVSYGHLDEDDLSSGIVEFSHILGGKGGHKVNDYVQAVAFCTHRIMNDSQVAAYKKVFPERCKGKTEGAIAGKASIYSNGKLITQILGFAQVPTHLLYMRERHMAVRKLADLVSTGFTERIQLDAADKLLTHIKPPEEVKIELDVGLGAQEMLDDMKASLDRVAELASKKLADGTFDAKVLIQS